jgi:hypothetical protein
MRDACVAGDIDMATCFMKDSTTGWRHSIDGIEMEILSPHRML